MSSFDRPLSGTPLLLRLDEEQNQTEETGLRQARGKTARTLVKDGALRVTLVTLGPGGELPEHKASGPITVQPLSGHIRFTVEGTGHRLGVGDFLALEPEVRHTVTSDQGGTFLLTVAQPERAG